MVFVLHGRRAGLAIVGVVLGVGFMACTLDEAGSANDAGVDVGIDDVTVDHPGDAPNEASQDAGPDSTLDAPNDVVDASDAGDGSDGFVPCTTLDASCVPTFPVDGGWTPLGLSVDAGSCAFLGGSLLADAQAAPGSCACGCAVGGTASCGAASYGGFTDPTCTSISEVADGSVSGAGCVDVGDLTPDAGVIVSPPLATGATCDAGVVDAGGVIGTTLTTCEPTSCNNDYCGLKKQGYRLCIAHSSPAVCPSGYPISIAAVASASLSCTGCSCKLGNTQCTGSVSTFGQAECDGGSNVSFAATGTCTAISAETLSLSYTPNSPPTVTCTTGSLGGTVSTVGPVVLCCTP